MIRRARPHEHSRLTEISFAAKNYWNYPQEYLLIWHRELTITSEYIVENEVYVDEHNGSIVGYYSLTELDAATHIEGTVLAAGLWLEHMFILPDHIGKRIGSSLFRHCIEICSTGRHEFLHILADPNACGFYKKMGCEYLSDYPSTIAGRTTPYLLYRLACASAHTMGEIETL